MLFMTIQKCQNNKNYTMRCPLACPFNSSKRTSSSQNKECQLCALSRLGMGICTPLGMKSSCVSCSPPHRPQDIWLVGWPRSPKKTSEKCDSSTAHLLCVEQLYFALKCSSVRSAPIYLQRALDHRGCSRQCVHREGGESIASWP